MGFGQYKDVDAKEEFKATKDVLAKNLADLDKQQSITITLNVKANLKETKYHQALDKFHNHDVQKSSWCLKLP